MHFFLFITSIIYTDYVSVLPIYFAILQNIKAILKKYKSVKIWAI